MFRRQVTLGDAEEAGQAAFRGEKVITGLIEFTTFDAIADRQQTPFRPEQEAEIHREGEIARLVAQRHQARPQRIDFGKVEGAVGNMRLADLHQGCRPLGDLFALLRLDLMVEIGGELLDVARENRKVDDADRGEFVLAFDGGKRVLEADDALLQALSAAGARSCGHRADPPTLLGECRPCRRRRRDCPAYGRTAPRPSCGRPTKWRSDGKRDCRCRRPRRNGGLASAAYRCDTS